MNTKGAVDASRPLALINSTEYLRGKFYRKEVLLIPNKMPKKVLKFLFPKKVSVAALSWLASDIVYFVFI